MLLGGVGDGGMGPRDGPRDARFRQVDGYLKYLQSTAAVAVVVGRSTRQLAQQPSVERPAQITVKTKHTFTRTDNLIEFHSFGRV